MKRILLLVIALILTSVSMTSCLRDADESPLSDSLSAEDTNQTVKTIVTDETDDEAATTFQLQNPSTNSSAEPDVVYPINFYSQSPDNGSYVRYTEWSTDFLPARDDGSPFDLAVFALIPSDEPFLGGASYSEVWRSAAEKVGVLMDSTDIDFTVSYKLESGETEVYEIEGPGDAESVGGHGYIEMYLYDDVHQEPGVRYSHLTEDTLNDWVVVTTVKLTAGEKIDDVEQIFLTVRIAPKGEEISSGTSTIQIKRPDAGNSDDSTGGGKTGSVGN